MSANTYIHQTAVVEDGAVIGEGTKVWHMAQVREGAVIGRNCILGKNVYIDHNVKIGNNVKIQNNCSIYFETVIEDGVFIAPHVVFTNDKVPRAVNPDSRLKSSGTQGKDWNIGRIRVKTGASIGTHSTLLTDIVIGKWALVGAGSVVTKNVPDHGLVMGVPARLAGFVCKCGYRLRFLDSGDKSVRMKCSKCDEEIEIPKSDYERCLKC